ncbi:MAG: indole-3-glycerol-phosphate synthase [SAR324 cluster bacterium]|nr:indole-3-glycerol-phosphate synthase [SAR324 cluster bacterium]
MQTFLDKVRTEKLEEIAQQKSRLSEKELWHQVRDLPSAIPFSQSICRSVNQPLSIIAEVKAKAPNRENVKILDPEAIVRDYEKAGVRAISVLTDQKYFGGSLEILSAVHRLVKLPLLHKEFIVSPYQLLQGRLCGASAALILVHYFGEAELKEMIEKAKQTGMEAVVECSLPQELPRALQANPDILLINNRPIAAIPADPTQTYHQGSIDVSVQWWNTEKELQAWKQQDGKILISASCIDKSADVQKIEPLPYDAVLIGNAVMTASDRIEFLKSLMTLP